MKKPRKSIAVGDIVGIRGDHPWVGESGEVTAIEQRKFIWEKEFYPTLRVSLKNGFECFVEPKNAVKLKS